jgi:Zn-dependent protease/predicted transcriptional regulator
MFGRSIRIGRIAGIPIGVSPWWLAIVAFFTWMLGSSYFPEAVHGISPGASYALGLASVLLLFASILLHELGHAVVARRHGVAVEEIDLWLLGGVSKLRGDAHEPVDELRYALAGPAVSAIVTVCFGALSFALPSSAPAWVRALVSYEFLINALILGFNLVPAFPLDGGRALRALLWKRTGAMQPATEVAARIGRVFGYVLLGLGLLLLLGPAAYDGLWLAFIGFFIVTAARQQATGAQIRAVFSGKTAADLMTRPVVTIPAELPLSLAAREYFGRYPYTAFPVVDARGRALGIVTASGIGAARGHAGTSRLGSPMASRVGDIAESDPTLLIGANTDVAELLERPVFARVGRAIVVDAEGAPVGLVSITDVQRAIRSARLAASQDASMRGVG